MKGRIGLAVLLVAVSTGFVAPTVEAGRTMPSMSCTYIKTGASISITGSFSGIRFASISQPNSNVVVTYVNTLTWGLQSGTWTQTGRTSGNYSRTGSIPDQDILFVTWNIVGARGSVISNNSCTPGA